MYSYSFHILISPSSNIFQPSLFINSIIFLAWLGQYIKWGPVSWSIIKYFIPFGSHKSRFVFMSTLCKFLTSRTHDIATCLPSSPQTHFHKHASGSHSRFTLRRNRIRRGIGSVFWQQMALSVPPFGSGWSRHEAGNEPCQRCRSVVRR